MVRIGIVTSLIVLVSGLALCEPLRAISGRLLLLPYGIEGGAVSPDGRWFAAQGDHADIIVVHVATNALVRRFRTPGGPIRQFGLGFPFSAAGPIWDAQSRFVWAADTDTDAQRLPDGAVAAGESGRRRAHIAVAADPLAPAR
jgi:hypothetical protein